MKVTEIYSKKLLEKAQPSLILKKFSDGSKKYSWIVRLWRWLLRKKPEYKISPLPKEKKANSCWATTKNAKTLNDDSLLRLELGAIHNPIKFRRYSVIPVDDV